MDSILAAHQSLEKKGNLSKAVQDVQKLIDLLESTRDSIAAGPDKAALHMAKLKNPIKQSFDQIEDDLKDVNKSLNQYQKALKDKFKSSALPTATNDALASQPGLVNRAIAMHLLREGKFEVASTFVREVADTRSMIAEDSQSGNGMQNSWLDDFTDPDAMEEEDEAADAISQELSERSDLKAKFSEMYHVLDSLRNQHDLQPAIAWAREHSTELEGRGSNLEFELSRLKFVEDYTTSSDGDTLMMSNGDDAGYLGALRALEYARRTFPSFSSRYTRETSSLLGSLAFSPALANSPYQSVFFNQSSWDEASASFTREFCGMLGLSSTSPLYLAVTAGAISLPILEKVERIMAATRGQWTSVNELPVETPLPSSYLFHSIFVCPVSKEQATDSNPPMMLPCGHVIAKESLDQHSKGKSRMKCPYCPNESHPREAKRVYI